MRLRIARSSERLPSEGVAGFARRANEIALRGDVFKLKGNVSPLNHGYLGPSPFRCALSIIRELLATPDAMCRAIRFHSSAARRIYGRRHPPGHLQLAFRAAGVSLQDERERQFVGIERIAKIGKGSHQHVNFAQQLTKSERCAAPCQLEYVR